MPAALAPAKCHAPLSPEYRGEGSPDCFPRPSKILGDFKAWGARRLSERFGEPLSETWWTHNGSKRKLSGERAIVGAVHYVLYDQPQPLITWSPETGVCHGIPPQH